MSPKFASTAAPDLVASSSNFVLRASAPASSSIWAVYFPRPFLASDPSNLAWESCASMNAETDCFPKSTAMTAPAAAAAVPMPANAVPIVDPMPRPTLSAVAPTPLRVRDPETSLPSTRKSRSVLATAGLPRCVSACVDSRDEREVVLHAEVGDVPGGEPGERLHEVDEVPVEVRLRVVEPV